MESRDYLPWLGSTVAVDQEAWRWSRGSFNIQERHLEHRGSTQLERWVGEDKIWTPCGPYPEIISARVGEEETVAKKIQKVKEYTVVYLPV